MNDEAKKQITEAGQMLAEALNFNAGDNQAAAMKLAYEASGHIAAAYLLSRTNQRLLPNEDTYDLFATTMLETNHHPALSPENISTVSAVSVLREAYEPALLDETTPEEAQQMIEHVKALIKLVAEVAGNP